MQDDAAILLLRAGQEAGHIDQRNQRDVERVAEAHEARGFARGVVVEASGQHLRLVGHNAHRNAVEAGKAHDDIRRKVLVYFQKFAVVHHAANHLIHVVGLVGAVGDNIVQRIFEPVDRVFARRYGRFFEVVLRQVAQQAAD